MFGKPKIDDCHFTNEDSLRAKKILLSHLRESMFYIEQTGLGTNKEDIKELVSILRALESIEQLGG
jgi:hypothetical protein